MRALDATPFRLSADSDYLLRLEDLIPESSLRGILPDASVAVVSVHWHGSDALTLVYRRTDGRVADEILYRHDESRLQIVEHGRPWSFDGDGELFRLVSEAYRIHLAHLFDPVLAVHTSLVDPLPHQITAVYEAMLPQQSLRFLLADDPGAGKTIMAGLLIKELIARGDLKRCLVVCPGSLAEQWQDEMHRKFHLPFEILTNDKLEAARTGNWFLENDLAIARLDKLSRNEDVQQKLATPDCHYDLVICDEAHKLSATFFGGEVKYTKRYRLGQLLSGLTRHFLLMTATPHNGKEEDFQLFLALLDSDRFEGRFRDGVHQVEVSGLMRRMVKENLLKFDGTPLFPERIAYTVPFKLSDGEARLYKEVTEYVREEFNRAEALQNEKRAGTVGFALTILQRRLASSPEAIFQSLRRRRERLEKRLQELDLFQRSGQANIRSSVDSVPELDADDIDDFCTLNSARNTCASPASSLPDHIDRLFFGSSELAPSMRGHFRTRRDPLEVEADAFASELLMPDPFVRAAIPALPTGIPAIQRLATSFVVSLRAAGIRYVDFAAVPTMVLLSHNGAIEWTAISPSLWSHRWARRTWKGEWAPRGSGTRRLAASRARLLNGEEDGSALLLCEWLEGAPVDVEASEEAIGLGKYGRILTVISASELREPEDYDEAREHAQSHDWREALRGYRLD